MAALGPLVDDARARPPRASRRRRTREVDYLRGKNGAVRGGPADGRPSLARDVHACEAILALSGTTNGHLATQGFRTLEERTGTQLADLAAEHEGKQITFADTQAAPVPVITSPEWSGIEPGGRRYSPFTINVERLKPWHTLTGRQHFFLDHDWMTELGERTAGVPAAAEHDGAVRRAASRRAPASSASPCGTSPRTTSGRSTPSTRTTCSCSRCPAAARRSG